MLVALQVPGGRGGRAAPAAISSARFTARPDDSGLPMRRLCLALLFCLAACQPLPHPFADAVRSQPGAPPLSPPDSAGIAVMPVAGAPAPLAGQLAQAMAKALRDADVPASTMAHNQHSYRLYGAATQAPQGTAEATVTVVWRLETAAGRSLGSPAGTAAAPAAAWRQGDPHLATRLAGAAAPAIAALVEGDAPLPAQGIGPVVAVQGVTGAPGDGSRTLAQAIGTALKRANLTVAATPGAKASFILTGRVLMSPPAAGKQDVKVSWILARPDGSEVGLVRQENAVPAGSLDGAWGDVAYAVAAAAAPGIARLIRQARVTGAGG